MKSPLLIQLPTCLLVLLLVLFSVLKKAEVVEAATAPIIAMPGCKDSCGNVSIPYPFGIGTDCFLHPWFEVDCKVPTNSNGSAKPFLTKLGIEVAMIDLYPKQNVTVHVPPTNSCTAQSSIDLRGSPYKFPTDNVLVMEGCPGSAVVVNESNTILGGCDTSCFKNKNSTAAQTCFGSTCCQAQLNFNHEPQFYQIEFHSPSQSCLLAALLSPDDADDRVQMLSASQPPSTVPIELSWVWWKNHNKFQNSSHSTCRLYPDLDSSEPLCYCDGGFDGYPYVPGGCQAPEGCKGCDGICLRSGNYSSCFDEKKHHFIFVASLGSITSFGILLSVCGLYRIFRVTERRRRMKRRAKFFKRNGGLLLQKHLLSKEGVVERTKVFTASELEKATDSFSENRILGQGGQGTVYKAILTDGKIVAIKKSKMLDKNQLEQFINEVVVLSQINHRNVVKLLGCCLETEVPLLVYEFVSNGTLSQHIHNPDEDFIMNWEMRLKIAADSAGAIAYLHSSSSTPVYHRDIKSSNILLDERHRAKVSDFGCSKTFAIDQTHLTTWTVHGTWGCLDPEYFQTNQFTEKSDVYSFGVVLLELLTSKKPIYKDEAMEPKSLAVEFQNSKCFDMLDQRVVEEAKEEQLTAVVELAKRCVSWSRDSRPTMKEVAIMLETMIKSPAQVPTSNEQGFFTDEFGEDEMSEISNEDFMSNPFPATAGAGSPLYTDVRMPNTF